MAKDPNDLIRRGLNRVNTTLARHYSRAAQRDRNEAVRSSRGAQLSAHGATMSWGQLRDPAAREGMRRHERMAARERAQRSRRAATNAQRNARRARAAADRIR